ncbi:HD domain-containing protein [Desulfovibrio sp. OttesenSCG-928-F20]|nr:HD domain-containing protein [Desulfovibrio sp. OttesenSCG-928-F20]
MEVFLWGVRGSIPNPTQGNLFYGANTTCVELRLAGGEALVFDAGTGIRSLSKTLTDHGECSIFLTHGHSDHVQGLSFFQPFFLPQWTINLYLPDWLEDLPHRLFDGNSFPVFFSELRADIRMQLVSPGDIFTPRGLSRPVTVEAFACNHPGGSLAYKVRAEEGCFLFSGDHEITTDPEVQARSQAMLEGVDVAVVDAAYSRSDYRPGWGHSAWEDWEQLGIKTGLSTLILTHHSQDRLDSELDTLQRKLSNEERQEAGPMQIVVAREGMNFSMPNETEVECKPSNWLNEFIDSLSVFKEESVLLDRILQKTREITNADAGTFFLADDDDLVFAYSHNDTLFPKGTGTNKSAYVNMRLPITMESIAGYTAVTGQSLNLHDVHSLPAGVPYQFNDSFDKKTGYYTRSVLTMPIMSREKKLLGVLQLINSLHPREKTPQPFTSLMRNSVQILAREAATFLEISAQVRESINRLLDIAVLHDPSETGPHAERVGAVAAEIYHHWAIKKNVPPEQMRYFKSQIRLAAMLHDIGKVGISDLVLKKPGRLTEEEFAVMKQHTVLGSQLFSNESKDITEMAHEISLHHHQKWNGKGYPTIDGEGTLGGANIPLSSRITAIADVFDALVSPRCYKEPWSFERARDLLREEAGQHFDPDLVECFLEISDTVTMIYQRFPDQSLPPQPPA